ncbi:MAG: carboxymuconolactone decarboxylase family protein [Desulfarculaceae bacterium]|jgi:AhpD family alkylhydroperoxidase
MSQDKLPKQYRKLKEQFPELMDVVNRLGQVTHAGPLDDKTAHLIQLAGAAAARLEGSVHSHTRRALNAGATPEEVRQAVVLLTSTLGFPTVSATLSWVEDILSD